MKPARINLCLPVFNSVATLGYSTVAVVNAVNASLCDVKLSENPEEKIGDGRLTKTAYKVSGSIAYKWEGQINTPRRFDAWHSKVAAANKIAEFESVGIPSEFIKWMDGFAKAPAKSAAAQADAQAQAQLTPA